eukprot:11099006-Karenia_brevis.AAC.1
MACICHPISRMEQHRHASIRGSGRHITHLKSKPYSRRTRRMHSQRHHDFWLAQTAGPPPWD